MQNANDAPEDRERRCINKRIITNQTVSTRHCSFVPINKFPWLLHSYTDLRIDLTVLFSGPSVDGKRIAMPGACRLVCCDPFDCNSSDAVPRFLLTGNLRGDAFSSLLPREKKRSQKKREALAALRHPPLAALRQKGGCQAPTNRLHQPPLPPDGIALFTDLRIDMTVLFSWESVDGNIAAMPVA